MAEVPYLTPGYNPFKSQGRDEARQLAVDELHAMSNASSTFTETEARLVAILNLLLEYVIT
jgi:hypothetical protein